MKIFLIIFIIIVLAAGVFLLDLYRVAGEFKNIEPHFHGQIHRIPGVVGAEDITIHPQTGVALISCDDRRATFRGEPTKGGIYAYDLRSPNPQLVNLTSEFEPQFHPHGMSLFFGENGQERLFVVNHRSDGDFVEIFDYIEGGLQYVESINGELMHSPNDLVAVGPRSFYVTNDHGSASEFGRTLEDYLRLPKANVLYYDGDRFRVVANGIKYANGININRDGTKVYVAATTGGKIHLYNRDKNSGDLDPFAEVEVGTGVDNIEIDSTGNLWIGAHPKLLTFVKHSKDKNKLSPSQVLKITLLENNQYQIAEIFLSNGEDMSGSTVGAVFENRLLIGSVFDDVFLIGEMAEK